MSSLAWGSVLILMMSLSLTANSWVTIWVGLEGMILSLTPMLISSYNSSHNESFMKYFLIQAVLGLLFLLGVLVFWPAGEMLAVILLVKLGAVPFHFWVPHVFVGLSYKGLTLCATVMKAPSFFLLSQMQSKLGGVLALMTVFIGSLSALFYNSLKKLLSYSSIIHTGWLLSILGFGMVWIPYLSFYSLLMVGAWQFLEKAHLKVDIQSVSGSASGWLSLALVFLTLGGMPPLAGFSIKWLALSCLLKESPLLALGLSFSLGFSIYLYMKVLLMPSMRAKTQSTKTTNSYLLGMLLLSLGALPLALALSCFSVSHATFSW